MTSVQPCPYSEVADTGGRTGAHDFTDAYSPDGHPELLYCRRCGEVVLREPALLVPPATPDLTSTGSR